MVKISVARVFFLLVLVDIARSSLIPNTTIADVDNNLKAENTLKAVKTRRQIPGPKPKKKGHSTSSSRDRKDDSEANSQSSLNLSTDETTSSEDKQAKNKYLPKSSAERKGWRKWHRKCNPCIEDQVKKWRDPSINWICGGFQRARRSFKSLCMMHYRNCQDGTMFTKIHDHRCSNDSAGTSHGQHFFYEYKVLLSDESASDSSETSGVQKSSSSD